MMTHIDLFSGIGGFALAAKWAGYETVAFVEIDKFCQEVLAKHWPGVPIYEDIKKIQWVVADTEQSRTWMEEFGSSSQRWDSSLEPQREMVRQENGEISRERIRTSIKSVDLLTGGFPCQPFSCAGKRGGTEDDRYLWPEMLRAIHEVKPQWVLAENVPGILSINGGLAFEGVCTDLEAEGYEVIPLVIPACGKGAPHQRYRIWIVARDKNSVDGRVRRRDHGPEESEGERLESKIQIKRSNRHASDTAQKLFNGCGDRRSEGWGEYSNDYWQEHWYEVATSFCRVDDGLPRVVDRVNRLMALGNAIVPQVAYEIIRAIVACDTQADHEEK